MALFRAGGPEIHGKADHSMPGDLFLALKLILNNGQYQDLKLAVGEHEDTLFSELRQGNEISMVSLDKKSKIFRALKLDATTLYANGEFSEAKINDRVAVIALLLKEVNPSLEDFSQFEQTLGERTFETLDQETELLSILSGIMTELVGRVNKESDPLNCVNEKPRTINMSQVETGSLSPSKVILGEFVAFQLRTKVSRNVNVSEIKDKFVLNKDRVFTSEEKDMMFSIPSYYSVSSNVLSIAEKVKASWDKDPNLRKTNILMEGPAGTGKTLDSKVLSSLLGLPYTKITCFADMDSSDVTGAILPVANEEIDIPIPSDDEIFFDPQGCYERLTGKEADESITEADVREAINEVYASFYDSESGRNTPRYVYFASEIVKAFENGYLCEIQEPTCIADAAVLLILNSALEKEGVINLAQRTVKRHPECIFVITTNRDYEGCRPLNQALRDRFNITKKVSLPDTEEQVDRLSSATGCTDRDFLRDTVTACNALNEHLQNEGINANISLRGMQDFVADVMNGFDIRESVMECLVYKISTDTDEVAEMENFLSLSTRIFNLKGVKS